MSRENSLASDTQARVRRLNYARPPRDVVRDSLIDESGDCIARQYEWSDDHINLGAGCFLRKNIMVDDLGELT